jgi:hypothetical protein
LRDDRGPRDAEVIEQRDGVGRERRGTGPARRVGRLAEATLVHRDAPVLLGEHRDLLPPAQVVAAGAVQEQHRRRVAARVLVVETKAPGRHERHRQVSSATTSMPAAVIAAQG